MSSHATAVTRLLFFDLLGSVIWFPVWWYTTGVKHVVTAAMRALQFRAREYGLRIWIQHLFVPMYGQYDVTGRLVSVFMRFVVLVERFIALALESVVYGIGVIAWVAAPVAFLVLATMSATR